jgi:hypothetical protein
VATGMVSVFGFASLALACLGLYGAALVLTGSAPERSVGWHANESLEQGFKACVFGRTGSSRKFGHAYG